MTKNNDAEMELAIGQLVRRLEVLLVHSLPSPKYDVAVDAIRDFQREQERANRNFDDDPPCCDVFDARITTALEKRFGAIFLSQLERLDHDRLSSVPGFGKRLLGAIAEKLRQHFRRSDDRIERIRQWYWREEWTDENSCVAGEADNSN